MIAVKNSRITRANIKKIKMRNFDRIEIELENERLEF